MDSETVELRIPISLYRAARQVARATDQSVDAVLQASIAHALPPLDDLPEEEAAALAMLSLLDDGTLWQAARQELTPDEQAEMHRLLDRQAAEGLNSGERSSLDALLGSYGWLTVRKAHAHLLLARRGYHVPPQGAEIAPR